MQAHDAMLPNGPPPSQDRLAAPPRSASHLPPTAEEVGGPVPVRGARTSVARWAGALCKFLAVRPLPMMVGGLALVVLDFRTEALDLRPDIVGWALIAVATWRLALRAAACLAVAAGTASLADAWLPYLYVRVDPTTGERVPDGLGADLDYPLRHVYDDISGWRLAAVALAALLAGLALWTLLAGLGHLARSGGPPDRPASSAWSDGWSSRYGPCPTSVPSRTPSRASRVRSTRCGTAASSTSGWSRWPCSRTWSSCCCASPASCGRPLWGART